jgi:hypothetical protein
MNPVAILQDRVTTMLHRRTMELLQELFLQKEVPADAGKDDVTFDRETNHNHPTNNALNAEGLAGCVLCLLLCYSLGKAFTNQSSRQEATKFG